MSKRILVCGDAMIDRYWYSDDVRVSQEAPVAIAPIVRVEDRLGGAANVALNIRAMGGDVCALYSPSYEHDPVIKIRIISKGQQMIRADLDNAQEPVTTEQVLAAAEMCSCVVLSDYGKGTLYNISAIIYALKRAGKTVLVDPKGRSFNRYAEADLLKPNLAEMQKLIGGWDCEENLTYKVKALQRAAKIPTVLLTRGAQGMTLYNGEVKHIPAATGETVDVCGAGDVTLAAYATARSRGMCMIESCQVAAKAAGIAVSRFGTSLVYEKEVF